ncbi:hypothetical protein QYF36_006863 [Acer negundo]|nr:hypothetical protein QYF36_006863 [Acer negundo]
MAEVRDIDDLPKNAANYTALTPLWFLERAATVHPSRTSVVHQSKRYTWRQTYQRCRQMASALNKLSIGLGSTVAIIAPNVPAIYEAHFGVPMAGAVLNCVNIRLNAPAIAFLLGHSLAAVVMVDQEFFSLAEEALKILEEKNKGKYKPPILIVIGDESRDPKELKYALGRGAIEYEKFLQPGDPEFSWKPPQDEWQSIALGYTSGTTASPKGVVLAHRGAYLMSLSGALIWGMNEGAVYLWTLPMFHCNGWCYPWTLAALCGTSICLRQVTAKAIYSAIAKQLCIPVLMTTAAAALASSPEFAAVISFTSPRDAFRLACVSTTFRSAADSNVVWDRFLGIEYLSAISDPGPVSSLSKKELYIRSYYVPILNGELKRLGVCKYCDQRPARYLVESSEYSNYLCKTCYHRYSTKTKRHIYSFEKIKQEGRRGSFVRTRSASWEKLVKKWDDRIKNVPDGDDADNFFDSDAFEIDDRLLNESEKNYKNIIQEVIKWQYFRDRTEKEVAAEAYMQLKAVIEIKLAAASNSRKAAKKAANEAYEDLNAVEENDVVVSNFGKERAAEAEYPENTSEATLRMLAKKRLSSKINDNVLEEVYNDLVASEDNTKRRESESHSDNNGNKRRQESQDAFEIGELELEGYFDNGASVRSRRRGIWKPNGLRKCSRKLS